MWNKRLAPCLACFAVTLATAVDLNGQGDRGPSRETGSTHTSRPPIR